VKRSSATQRPLAGGAALLLGLLGLLSPASAQATPPGPAPAGEGLLGLALRAERERSGDYDGLAAEWLQAIAAACGRSAPVAASGEKPEAGIPDELVLELLLRRLYEIRPQLADPLALLPALEAASRLQYPDGLHRQLLRTLLADLYRRAGREKERAALQEGDGYLRRWAVIGPFGLGGASQIERSFPPEREIDPAASYPGRKGPLVWRVPPRPEGADQRVFPARWVYPRQGVIYLLAQARAERAAPAVIHAGSREPLSIWVNGRPLAEEDPGAARASRRAFGVRLAAGWNRILFKVAAGSESWLWARLSGPDGRPLEGLSLEPPEPKGSGGAQKLQLEPQPAGLPDPAWAGPFRAGAVAAWEKAVEAMAKRKAPPALLADARLGLALLLSERGEEERAVDQAEEALELLPADAVTQAHAAQVILQARYLPRDHGRSRARAAFEAAIRADPDYLPAYLPLARMLLEDNEPSRAAARLDEALARRPEFFAARLDLLGLFESRDWEAETVEMISALKERAPRSPAAHLASWRRVRARGNPLRALAEARAALELDHGRPEVESGIAGLSEETGDTAGAEAALHRRLALEPEEPQALERLAGFYEEHRQWDKALEPAAALEAQNPADPGPAELLGRLCEEAGRAEEARGWYDRALAREPGEIALSRYRARKADAGRDEFWKPYDESLEEWLPRIPPAERFPGAASVAVLDISCMRLYPDGSSSEYTHQAFRLLSEEAKEELASAPTPGELLALRTVSAEGRTLEPVPATGKSEYTLPALSPGATVEWAYRTDRPRFTDWAIQAHAFYFQDFEYRKPFLLSRYTVLIPDGLEVDLVERALVRAEGTAAAGSPALARVKKEEKKLPGGGRAVVYEAREVSRLERELGMPRREDYIPNVELLSRRSWDDVASLLEDSVHGVARPSHEIRRAAAEALSGKKAETPIEKARVLYDYVNELVADPAGPSQAVQVLITRSGDRTALFKGLLAAAGVENRWAFLRARDALLPADDGSHPRPDAFQERCVLVDPEGESPAWVSLAIRRSPFGKLPFAYEEGMALVLNPKGGARFAPVPARPLPESATSTTAELTLSGPELPDLSLHATVSLIGRSYEDYGQKEKLRTLKDDLKKQIFSSSAARFFPGAKLLSGDLPGLSSNGAPFALKLELVAPRALVARGKEEAVLRPVLQPAEMIKRFIRRPRREHPYRQGREMVIRDRTRIAAGPGFTFARVPQSVSHASRMGSYSLVFTREESGGKEGETLTVERELTLLPITLGPEEFPRIVEFCQAVDRAEEERLVLRRRQPAGAE
jgi:tetratricopeptide (TPR) repeat protein